MMRNIAVWAIRASGVVAAALMFAGSLGACQPAYQDGGYPTMRTAPGVPPAMTRDGLRVVVGNNHITGRYPTRCASIDGMPDPHCTPGSIRDDIDTEHLSNNICKPYWSQDRQPPSTETETAKTKLMMAYGVPAQRRSVVELDHFIPRSLGGSNDITNLWPQISDIPGAGYHNKKDGVESRIHDAVCVGRVTLIDAQMAIHNNWRTAERQLGLVAK
jgi:hypothetical protein